MTAGGQALDGARHAHLLSNHDLWFAYFALGGSMTYVAMTAYLADGMGVPVHEHNLLALALNESHMADPDHAVPYVEP